VSLTRLCHLAIEPMPASPASAACVQQRRVVSRPVLVSFRRTNGVHLFVVWPRSVNERNRQMGRPGIAALLVAGVGVTAGVPLVGTANAYAPPPLPAKVDFWTPSYNIYCHKDGTTGVYCLVISFRIGSGSSGRTGVRRRGSIRTGTRELCRKVGVRATVDAQRRDVRLPPRQSHLLEPLKARLQPESAKPTDLLSLPASWRSLANQGGGFRKRRSCAPHVCPESVHQILTIRVVSGLKKADGASDVAPCALERGAGN
jgi:hypothetical protein